MDLRGEDFSGPEDLSKAIQRSIRHISKNTLVEELKKLKSHLDDVYLSNPLKVLFILYITVLLVYLQSLSDALLLLLKYKLEIV